MAISIQQYDDILSGKLPIEKFLGNPNSENFQENLGSVLTQSYSRANTALHRTDGSGKVEVGRHKDLFLKCVDFAKKNGVVFKEEIKNSIKKNLLSSLNKEMKNNAEKDSSNHPLIVAGVEFLRYAEPNSIKGSILEKVGRNTPIASSVKQEALKIAAPAMKIMQQKPQERPQTTITTNKKGKEFGESRF